MKKENTLLYCTWDHLDKLIMDIKMHLEDTKYVNIAGIPRGGLIPAVMLSHATGLPLVPIGEAKGNTIIVDDIVDSGETVSSFMNAGYRVVALYERYTAKHKPEFAPHFLAADNWIVFPWESSTLTQTERDGTFKTNTL